MTMRKRQWGVADGMCDLNDDNGAAQTSHQTTLQTVVNHAGILNLEVEENAYGNIIVRGGMKEFNQMQG